MPKITKNFHEKFCLAKPLYTQKHEVDRAWPVMTRLLNAARANFGQPGMFK